MALSDQVSRKIRTSRAILEVIDVSFKWYLACALILGVVDFLTKGALRRLGMPWVALAVFIVVSGVLKLFYRLSDLQTLLYKLQASVRQKKGRWHIVVLSYFLFLADIVLKRIREQVLRGESFTTRLPILLHQVFVVLLILYMISLTGEAVVKGWSEQYLRLRPKVLGVWVFISGVINILIYTPREIFLAAKWFRSRRFGLMVIGIVSVLGGWISYHEFIFLGAVRVALGVLTAAIIAYLATVFVEKDKEVVSAYVE